MRIASGNFCRIGRAPQLKSAVQTIDVAEALADEIGGRALAGVAVVAGHDHGRVEVGGADEVGDVVVVQVLGATDVGGVVGRLVADVYNHRALLAQGLGLRIVGNRRGQGRLGD